MEGSACQVEPASEDSFMGSLIEHLSPPGRHWGGELSISCSNGNLQGTVFKN